MESKIKHPFKVPSNYFNELEQTVLSNIKLEGMENSVLKAPDKYFEVWEANILAKTVNKKSTFIVSKTNNIKFFRGAAALALISMAGYFGYNNLHQKDDFANISNDEMVDYLSSQPIENHDFTNVFSDKTLNEININSTKNIKE